MSRELMTSTVLVHRAPAPVGQVHADADAGDARPSATGSAGAPYDAVRPVPRTGALARARHRLLSPPVRLALLAVAALLSVAAFCTYGVVGSWDYVLPRRLTTVATLALVGYAIAVSTVLFQTVTDNRILTPAIMGFDSLFVLLQTVLVAALGTRSLAGVGEPVQFAVEVTVMVVLSGLLFRWLFLGAQRSLHVLVLVGIVLGVMFRSVSGFVQRLMDPNEFVVLQDRLFAGFTAVDPSLLLLSAALVAVVSLVVVRRLGAYDVLGLGRDTAICLGVDHRRAVSGVLVLVAVLVSVSTALVGPVTFVGLLVANLAYAIAGRHEHRWVLPTAALLAVIALVGGQALLQHAFGLDTALVVIVEFIGGIVFIGLLLRGLRP